MRSKSSRADREHLEKTISLQRLNVVGHILGHFGDSHLGNELPDNGPFGGIIVDEDQRILPDAQLRGDSPQIRRLVVPIGHEAGNILQA